MPAITLSLAAGGLHPFPKYLARRKLKLPRGLPLHLEREPRNPYDGKAIGVWAATSTLRSWGASTPEELAGSHAVKLGYIPASTGERDYAAILAPVMDDGVALDATVVDSSGVAVLVRISAEGVDLAALVEAVPVREDFPGAGAPMTTLMLLIVKAHLAVDGNAGPALVYDKTQSWHALLPVTPGLIAKMKGRPTAFFYAERAGEDLALGDDAPWQEW